MKATLLSDWVRNDGFSRTLLGLTLALSMAAGCGDSPSEETSSTGGDATATTGASANTTGMTASNTTAGGMQVDPDAGSDVAGDDVSTPGHDSTGATACMGVDTCGYATHSCCVAGLANSKCIEGTTCEGTGARTVCDGMEDCTGDQVCCVIVNGPGTVATNGCYTTCPVVGNNLGVWQICHTEAECPSGTTCIRGDAKTFPFWGFCM